MKQITAESAKGAEKNRRYTFSRFCGGISESENKLHKSQVSVNSAVHLIFLQ
jgi:hypothetical protein